MTITLRPHQRQACDAMQAHDLGQIIIPTGGGKTICMIEDAKKQLENHGPKTIVVVAPRILLANQLCSEFLEIITDPMVRILHVHSGETNPNLVLNQDTFMTGQYRLGSVIVLSLLPIILYIVLLSLAST